MFNQFTALFQTSLKPINQLVELNLSTANAVAHQQGLLIACLIDEGLSFSQNISAASDIADFVEQQSNFGTNVQSQLTETIIQTAGILTKTQKDTEVIIRDSLSNLSTTNIKTLDENQFVVPKLLAKEESRSAVKISPKAAEKTTPKAAVKASPKAAVKASPKAAVKASPKAAEKATPKAAVKATPKAVVKATPKAVVKATPKAAVKAEPKAAVKAEPKAAVKAEPNV